MKKLFKRNYEAVVKRGLITKKTTDLEFMSKLLEETQETLSELSKCNLNDQRPNFKIDMEIADCLIVCSNWLNHRGVNLDKILTFVAIKNENRI